MVPIVHEPLNHLVPEIFSIRIADTQIDNKGRLKLAAARANSNGFASLKAGRQDGDEEYILHS